MIHVLNIVFMLTFAYGGESEGFLFFTQIQNTVYSLINVSPVLYCFVPDVCVKCIRMLSMNQTEILLTTETAEHYG